MTTWSEPSPPPDAVAAEAGRGRTALGFAGALLAVLVVIVLGSRSELALTFGVSGDAGTFAAKTCGRDLQYDGTTTRAQCLGTFAPASGATPYRAELYYDGDPGRTYEVRADPDSRAAYRTDVWSRWAALALPLIPVGLMWLAVGGWWAFRRPGVLSRRDRWLFLAGFATPATAVLAAAAVGFVVALGTT